MPVEIEHIDTEIEVAPASAAPAPAASATAVAPPASAPTATPRSAIAMLEAALEEYLRMRG
ncbi:MAG: hypothetical protein KIT31_01990 [Deltaproteobacteria bacterium]|nr:hypothetical protein [Deltaproteobacteria bacterium]